jgi:transcription initiation factor TFIID subunit 2
MDLQTMSHKLEGGKYPDRFAFQADFRLMMANAKLYNPVGSYAHDETLALETYFEKRRCQLLQNAQNVLIENPEWTIINKTLEAAHAKEALQRPPPKVLPPVPQAFPDPPPSEPTPSTSRQTIKFKAPQPKEATPKLVPKPSRRKPKVELPPPDLPTDPPPPPYEDDGSHDILQEVLALEREKDEKVRHRSSVTTNGKRKKVDISTEEEDEAEDDLLALATPAKKGRPSPPEASSSAVPKIVLKSKPPADPPESRAATVDVPRISVKGKEKEVPVAGGSSAHRSKKSPVAQAVPVDEKKCKQLLTTLMKLPESGIFLRPVDPELDGCPTSVFFSYFFATQY